MAIYASSFAPRTGPSPASSVTPNYMGVAPLVDDNARRIFANNADASSQGVARAALNSGQKAGLSRGMGQQRMADLAQRGANADARNQILSNESEASLADARSRSAIANQNVDEQLAYKQRLEQLRQAQFGVGLAQREWKQNMYEAMRRGQFGLDSMYPPYSSFVSSFFS